MENGKPGDQDLNPPSQNPNSSAPNELYDERIGHASAQYMALNANTNTNGIQKHKLGFETNGYLFFFFFIFLLFFFPFCVNTHPETQRHIYCIF